MLGNAGESPSLSLSRNRRTPTVALLPFVNVNQKANGAGLGHSVAAMFGTHLKNETNFTVLERTQLSKVLQEQNLSDGGMTEAQRTQLGKLYQVEAILTGEVAMVDDLIQLDARLVSVETGQVLVAEYAQVEGYSQLRQAILKISRTLEMKYLRRWMGNLVISVQPVDGEVYLDDQFVGKATLKDPLVIDNLLEGQYQLKVLASGYSTSSETVNLTARMRREVQVALKALPGSIRFLSEPVGARVRLNNRDLGPTPILLDTVQEGSYHAVYELDGFQVLERDVAVRSGQQSEVKGVLKVKPGFMNVTSMPSGAEVYLNDRRMGNTPLPIENVPPGTLSLRLEMPAFATVRDVVTVRPGETVEWGSPLHKLTGTMSVVSPTDSVQVTVVDATGRVVLDRPAPFHRQELEIGTYAVHLARPNFETWMDTVKVLADKDARTEASLRELPARISVRGSHPVADVWVDGVYAGRSGQILSELPKGRHSLQWSSFFETGSDSLVLKADETRETELTRGTGGPLRWMIPIGLLLSAALLFLAGGK
jgi:TolB-like protein